MAWLLASPLVSGPPDVAGPPESLNLLDRRLGRGQDLAGDGSDPAVA